MTSRKPTPLTNVLRSLAPPLAETDVELLRRFCTDRDEVAFQAIVRRHGGLVLDVCQAVLRNRADADDAFQATFLTLATRAASIRSPAALSSWLHGTAYRISLKARVAASRRSRYEANVNPGSESPPVDPSWAEVRQAIHEAVRRLPAAEREAIVLCYLIGRTQDEAGQSLGLTKDGVKKRLERGRELLRKALTRRGFGPAAILALASMPLVKAPRALASSTSDLALGLLGGNSAGFSSTVMPLIERGTSMFTATKVLIGSSLFAAISIVAIAGLWYEPNAIATAAPQLQPEPKDRVAETELDGVWKVVAIESKGVEVSADDFKGLKFTFGKGKLVVGEVQQDKEPVWSPRYLNGSTLKVASDKGPKQIDFVLDPKVKKDATIEGIYQIRQGKLKIAVRTLADIKKARPRGYATVSGTLLSYTLELMDQKEGK